MKREKPILPPASSIAPRMRSTRRALWAASSGVGSAGGRGTLTGTFSRARHQRPPPVSSAHAKVRTAGRALRLRHGRSQAARRRDGARSAHGGRQPRRALPPFARGGGRAGRRTGRGTRRLLARGAWRPERHRLPAGARGAGRRPLRPHRRAHQQRFDFLSDTRRLHHCRAVRRPRRHEPAGAAVPVAGRSARAARDARAHHQHGGHPRAGARSGLTRCTRRQRRGSSC